ncbi:MAG: hypothetical protein VX834_07020 [Myxococcota bacterium]|nr:hypothetical protein [Myxococcota bacterium]
MASIDDIIARSRDGGEFSERKTFTLTRNKAIEKMRNFALAKPEYYVLELIQAAVASGADCVSVLASEDELIFSYTGAYITSNDLNQLFDYLFASKDKLGVAHLRELALGINALLSYRPKEIIIESGVGMAHGSARMVLRDQGESIDIGTADTAIDGTYVRAVGLRPPQDVGGNHRLDVSAAIEERCLAMPIPLMLNGEAPFGYTSVRMPSLWGYQNTLSFDEEDLYGTLGVGSVASEMGRFRILTQGVWIQSVDLREEQIEGIDPSIGGIVNFDRLRKTADHAAIVRDEVFAELWLRLRPHALEVMGEESAQSLEEVTDFDGNTVAPRDLSALLRTSEKVVIVSSTQLKCSEDEQRVREGRARRIAEALGATVLIAPGSQLKVLRSMSRDGSNIVVPELRNDTESDFYSLAKVPSPPAPWLASPIETPPILLKDILASIAERDSRLTAVCDRLRGLPDKAKITGMLYVPRDLEGAENGVYVRALVGGRLVWQGQVAGHHRGQWLDVELTHIGLEQLTNRHRIVGDTRGGRSSITLAQLIAEELVQRTEQEQRTIAQRSLRYLLGDSYETSPSYTRAFLPYVESRVVARFRAAGGTRLAALDNHAGITGAKIFATVKGERRSLEDLTTWMDQSFGLFYGINRHVLAELDGLDTRHILDLDHHEERLLSSVFGEAAYVRIDRRDVLAEQHGIVCRDIALGLREYPDFPLLVEGDVGALSADDRDACLEMLVEQLVGLYVGTRRLAEAPDRPRADLKEEAEENRRQACRHLQWFVCHQYRHGQAGRFFGVDALPLFLDEHGRPVSAREVFSQFQNGVSLHVYYGARLGHRELSSLTHTRDEFTAKRSRVFSEADALALSPFTHALLRQLGDLRLSFDFDTNDIEAEANPDTEPEAFLVSRLVTSVGCMGRVGIAASEVSHPAVVVVTKQGDRLGVVRLESGLVGFVTHQDDSNNAVEKFADSGASDELLQSLNGVTPLLMMDLLALHHEGIEDGAKRIQVENKLLELAQKYFTLTAAETGMVTPSVVDGAAERIFRSPWFVRADGSLCSAWSLIVDFCNRWVVGKGREGGENAILDELSDECPAHLRAWASEALSESHVVHMNMASSTWDSESLGSEDYTRSTYTQWITLDGVSLFVPPQDKLGARLTLWLDRLRPDPHHGTAEREGWSRTLVRTVFEPQLLSLNDYRALKGNDSERQGWSFSWRKKLGSRDESGHQPMQWDETLDYATVLGGPHTSYDSGVFGEGRRNDLSSFFRHKGIFARYVPGSSGELVAGEDSRSVVWLNQDHALVERWAEAPPPPKMLAWLLLACYGHMNAAYQTSVTAYHEQVFHLRVLKALADGIFEDEQISFD